MAVKMRLQRHGSKKRPFYFIVVADARAPRDGKFIEILGNYNTSVRPSALTMKEDRVKHWISIGAQPSDTVSHLIEKKIPGYLKEVTEAQKAKLKAKRAKRKAALAASGKTAPKKAVKEKAAPKKKKAKKAAE